MSYESITSSVFTNLRSRLRDLPSRLTSPLKSVFGRRTIEHETETPVSPEARERAATDIEAFANENATLFDRLDRWNERTKRLREEGTPSESAANRASRSRREILDALHEVRESLSSRYGDEGASAFDAELRRRHTALFED